MELRVGIAGAGAMGRNHARVYNSIDGVRLEGVYDVDRDRAEALTADFGGKVVRSLEALPECCEAVSVTVPTNQHSTIGGKLLQHGTHILVEKPIASSEEEAENSGEAEVGGSSSAATFSSPVPSSSTSALSDVASPFGSTPCPSETKTINQFLGLPP